MITSSILSIVGGGITGLLQSVLEKKQDTKKFQIEKELDNKRFEIEQRTTVELAKSNIDIEKYRSITAQSQLEEAEYNQKKDEYKAFVEAQMHGTTQDGGLSKHMRPLLTIGFFLIFLLQFLWYIFIAIGIIGKPEILTTDAWEMLKFINEFSCYTLDYIVGYWFVRRSTEKQNFFQKKKS